VGERKSVSRRGLLAGRKRQMGSGALIRDRTKAVAGSKGTASQLRCKLSSDCACRSENGLLEGSAKLEKAPVTESGSFKPCKAINGGHGGSRRPATVLQATPRRKGKSPRAKRRAGQTARRQPRRREPKKGVRPPETTQALKTPRQASRVSVAASGASARGERVPR